MAIATSPDLEVTRLETLINLLDGKKKIVERSWFNRGNMIVVNGMRRDNDFIMKKYCFYCKICHVLIKKIIFQKLELI